MEIDPNMTIKEWIEKDLDRGAWNILAWALWSIETKQYQHAGCPQLSPATQSFIGDCDPQHPEWVAKIRTVLEAHKPDGCDWPDVTAGPKGPYG